GVQQVFWLRFLKAYVGLEVGLLVGEAESSGADVGDGGGRVVVVGRRRHGERREYAEAVQVAHDALQIGRRPDSGDLAQDRLHRGETGFGNGRLVHAGTVEIADLLLYRSLRPVVALRDRLEYVLELCFRIF